MKDIEEKFHLKVYNFWKKCDRDKFGKITFFGDLRTARYINNSSINTKNERTTDLFNETCIVLLQKKFNSLAFLHEIILERRFSTLFLPVTPFWV